MSATLCLAVLLKSALRKFVLVWGKIDLLWWLFYVICAGGRILQATSRILRTPWSGISGLLAGVSGSCCQITFPSVWISCHMHYTWSLHSPAHPTVEHIRVTGSLEIYANCWRVKSKLKFKFMAYVKGELLYARSLLLNDYQIRYMWVVINHQKGRDWKWSRPLSGFWW